MTGRVPQRIQQRRTKGWRLPENAVSVARPSRWGNPWSYSRSADGLWHVDGPYSVLRQSMTTEAEVHQAVVDIHEAYASHRGAFGWAFPTWTLDDLADALGGRDLACWCPLDQPCHADTLLALANGEGQ